MSRAPDLRLIVITDAVLAARAGRTPRTMEDIVLQAIAAGAPAIQLRNKSASAREMVAQARALLDAARTAGTLLFINDRLDVALTAGADGVHLGPNDIPIAAARRIAPADFLIGYSTDDPVRARRAQDDGASYIGCGAVFGTTTKTDVGDERIGLDRLREVVDAVDIPVIAIGGITTANAGTIPPTGAAGVAVAGAVMASADPARAVKDLLASQG